MHPSRFQSLNDAILPVRKARDSRSVCRRGFTIPEAAVILVLVLNLLAVVIPFLLHRAETSRQNQCVDNLRQITAALTSFDEKGKQLPPGQIARKMQSNKVGRFADPDEATATGGDAVNSGASWVTGVLPHLGGDATGLEWNHKVSVSDNRAVGMVDLSMFYCPSRRSTMKATGSFAACQRVTADWIAGGNDYAGCSGSGISFHDDARQTFALTNEQLVATYRSGNSPFSGAPSRQGAFQVNTRVTLSAISNADGLSNVMLVAERRVTTAGGSPILQSSDGWAWGGPATLFSARFSPRSGLHYDEADSSHPNQIHAAMADGRVRRVSVNVDLKTWQNLGNYASGRAIDHPNFRNW